MGLNPEIRYVDNGQWKDLLPYTHINSKLIPADSNLDDIKDEGTYYNNYNEQAKQINNTPEDFAFSLIVLKNAGVTQIFITFPTRKFNIYIRNYYQGPDPQWGEWHKIQLTPPRIASLLNSGYLMEVAA